MPDHMSQRSVGWYMEHWAPLGALAFVALFIVGGAFLGTPDSDASSQAWAAHFADEGNRVQAIASMVFFALSGLAFFWFAWGLTSRLQAAEGDGARLSTLALASAGAFVVALIVAAAAIGSVASGIAFGDNPVPTEGAGGEIARALESVGFTLFLIPGMFAASAMVALVSVSSWQTRLLPRWLCGLGFVTAIALLFAAIFLPVIALAIWSISVGIYQLTHERVAHREAGSPPMPAAAARA